MQTAAYLAASIDKLPWLWGTDTNAQIVWHTVKLIDRSRFRKMKYDKQWGWKYDKHLYFRTKDCVMLHNPWQLKIKADISAAYSIMCHYTKYHQAEVKSQNSVHYFYTGHPCGPTFIREKHIIFHISRNYEQLDLFVNGKCNLMCDEPSCHIKIEFKEIVYTKKITFCDYLSMSSQTCIQLHFCLKPKENNLSCVPFLSLSYHMT